MGPFNVQRLPKVFEEVRDGLCIGHLQTRASAAPDQMADAPSLLAHTLRVPTVSAKEPQRMLHLEHYAPVNGDRRNQRDALQGIFLPHNGG